MSRHSQIVSATPTRVGFAMGKLYEHLKAEERTTVMLMQKEGTSLRGVAKTMNRAPRSISRELGRQGAEGPL